MPRRDQTTIELEVIRATRPVPARRAGPSRRLPIALLLVVAVLVAATAIRLWPRPLYIPLGSRAVYSSGACVEYGPSSGNSRPTIFVDAGHGGPDPGVEGLTSAGNPVTEKAETLAVALDLMYRLAKDGYRVVLSRIRDTSVVREAPGLVADSGYTAAGEHADIEARIDCANAAHAAILLSIHFNGFTDPSVGGTATIYDDARPFTAQNERFADLVQSAILNAWAAAHITIPDRGVTPDSAAGTPALTAEGAAYGHLLLLGPAAPDYLTNPSDMPGALSEPLFLSDGSEASLADSSFGRSVLEAAYADAINRYFKSG